MNIAKKTKYFSGAIIVLAIAALIGSSFIATAKKNEAQKYKYCVCVKNQSGYAMRVCDKDAYAKDDGKFDKSSCHGIKLLHGMVRLPVLKNGTKTVYIYHYYDVYTVEEHSGFKWRSITHSQINNRIVDAPVTLTAGETLHAGRELSTSKHESNSCTCN